MNMKIENGAGFTANDKNELNETEIIPAESDVRFVFGQLLGLKKYETVGEKIYDEKGLCAWTIRLTVEGGYAEYSYLRGGIHKARIKVKEGHIPEDDIYVTFYDNESQPETGGLVAVRRNKRWMKSESSS